MVLGLGKKSKGSPVALVFDVSLVEVKPWPSSTLPPALVIHWQRGDKRSGSTKVVAGDRDRIPLNHSFAIPVTLYRLAERGKSGSPRFHKKCIVFSLCEAGEQGIARGQPLGRAVLDLADYGGLKDSRKSARSSIPLAVARKEFSVLGTPYLSLAIAPQGLGGLSSAAVAEDKAKEEEDHASLIASLVSDDEGEEEEEEDEIAAFTDDEEVVEEEEKHADKSHHQQAQDKKEIATTSADAAPPTSSPPPPPSRSPPPPPPPPTSSSQSPSPPPTNQELNEPLSPTAKNQRVQRILSSAAASAPSSSSAASAAAASALASTRKPSFSAAGRKGGEVEATQQSKKGATAKPNGGSNNVLQAARLKYAEAAGERSERLDKRAVEEARQRAEAAEAKAAAAEQERKKLEEEVANLKCELREAGAVELAVYSVVAQHGSSSHKIHAPARRLARIYMYACKNASQSARASTARTCAAAFVVVVRACENDVSRLTFWWSNVVVMREMVSQAFDTASSPAAAPEEDTQQQQQQQHDWRETSTLASTLERIEAWIFGRIVECIWWQSLTPHMQSSATAAEQSSAPSTPSSVVSRIKKSVRGLVVTDFEDSRQGMLSIEIWKAAFLDALQRICPVRAGGHDCGCLQTVTRMIIEQCVARLDVAMFNAILRDLDENVPTDPISDPITDLSVLPIPPDGVSFGGGAQLKNVINTWSTWLLTLTAESARGDEAAAAAAAQENVEKGASHFTLLRAMSDLLMLPKDMLMDKTVRKEVCPALSLLLIRRVLSKFVPDEYSPDPIPPSLLAALNAEISMERQKVGEEDVRPTTVIMASAPPVVYFPPSPAVIANMFADMRTAATSPKLVRSSSLYRKGHTSDDELEEIESPLFLLADNGCIDPKEAAGLSPQIPLAQRYNLLRQAWR